jgi:type II secretory pathway component PulF
MERAYKYTAKNSAGKTLTGIVHAKSKPLAFSRLKRGGFKPLRVELSVGGTLSALFHKNFNQTELARFYTTLGRRMQNGKSMGDGLESAIDYVTDPRLRQAVMMMRQSMIDGQAEHAAMLAAGFPRRDCLSIKSTAEAGKTADSFITLGDEIKRNEAMKGAVAQTFRVPKILAIFMVILIWGALTFMAPMTLAFLKQTGLRLTFSPFLIKYFEFVRLFNGGVPRTLHTTVISSVIYFSVFFALAYFLHSQTFRRFLDNAKSLRTLSVKSDHAALWNSFVLLYDAAIPAKEAATIVGDAAKRQDSRKAFHQMGRLIDAGRSLDDAVTNAGFPAEIMSGVKAAVSSGSIAQGLQEMSRNLEEDVNVLTAVLQENIKLMSMGLVGLGLLLVFVLTYYPMVASVMGNL